MATFVFFVFTMFSPSYVQASNSCSELFGSQKSNQETSIYSEEEFISYIDAKNLVIEAGISNVGEYRSWRIANNLTQMLPADPTKYYDELKYAPNPLGEFLNSDRIQGRRLDLVTYNEARSIVIANRIRTIMAYRKFRKENRRFDLPYNPDNFYGEQWKAGGGARGFFNKFIPYLVAQRLVIEYGITSKLEFISWRKQGNRFFIPADPAKTYEELRGVKNPLYVFLGLHQE